LGSSYSKRSAAAIGHIASCKLELGGARKAFNVDERQLYLAGQSMGGAGALFRGIKHRRVWAAVAASAPAIQTQLHTPSDLEQAVDMPIISRRRAQRRDPAGGALHLRLLRQTREAGDDKVELTPDFCFALIGARKTPNSG
jgi:alpha-beta hydrolase superfamily lysophospholipase